MPRCAVRSGRQISIHALREEGDGAACQRRAADRISIHALREEGDHARAACLCGAGPISIHALREEGDTEVMRYALSLSIFLSTPSARRATFTFQTFQQAQQISIHALREEGDDMAIDLLPNLTPISIHALREEGDEPRHTV